MPLTMAKTGERMCIKQIMGKDGARRFLESLGFVVGEPVSIVTKLGRNVIINIKDTRVAIDKAMANRIMV